MIRFAIVLAILLCFCAACGAVNRELTGNTPTLAIAQTEWLAAAIEEDCAQATQFAGTRVEIGRCIVRIDGEVVSTAPLMTAAMRGLMQAGATVVEHDQGEQQPAAEAVISGTISSTFEPTTVPGPTLRKYTIVLVIKDQSGAVRWTQTYSIRNTVEQQRHSVR